MTSARTRGRLIDRLRAEGIADETVLAAMNEVPRHIFIDEPIGFTFPQYSSGWG